MRHAIARLMARRGVFMLALAGIMLLISLACSLWVSLPTGPRQSWKEEMPEGIRVLGISGDGRTLAVPSKDGVTLWDLPSGRKRVTFPDSIPGNSHSWGRFQLSPDGQNLLVSHDSRNPYGRRGITSYWQLWSISHPQEPIFDVWHGEFESCLFSSDCRTLVLGASRNVGLWDLATGNERSSLPFKRERTHHEALADGRIVAVENTDQESLRIWDLGNLSQLGEIPGANRPVCISGNGKVFVEKRGADCKIWDLETGKENWSIQARDALLNMDGSRLIVTHHLRPTSTSRGEQELWDVGTQPPRSLMESGKAEFGFSPDGNKVAVYPCGKSKWPEGTCEVRDSATLQHEYFTIKVDPHNLTFSPDSTTAAFEGPVSTVNKPFFAKWLDQLAGRKEAKTAIHVMDIPTGKEVATIENCANYLYFPDGKSMACILADGTIQIWDIPARRPLLVDFGLPIGCVLLLAVGFGYWRWYRNKRAA